MRFIFDQHPLSDTQLKHAVPSVFADQPYHGMSPRYGFIPTSQVVGAMRDGGWQPVHARQTSPRSPAPEYARHMMRFRREETKVDVGDGFAEIVLVNSHDGTSAYQMHVGFFRLVCANGLIVDDGSFARISIRHSGDVVGRVMQAAAEFLHDVPRLAAAVERMREAQLTDDARRGFAAAALQLRYGEAPPIGPMQLLVPRRYEDCKQDLWTTFNIVQEHLMCGGLRGENANGKRIRTRGIRAIGADLRLNKSLWQLASGVLQAAAEGLRPTSFARRPESVA